MPCSAHALLPHTPLTLLSCRHSYCAVQGPSPDEVALVEAARQMGFEFKARTQNEVVLEILGQAVTYEVLNVMEYSSDR